MENMITKIYDCGIKALGERKYEFTASTGSVDRDGEVVEVETDTIVFSDNPAIGEYTWAQFNANVPSGGTVKGEIETAAVTLGKWAGTVS